MKHVLSSVREKSPFATPPRVLVIAEESAGSALSLMDALEAAGADAEVRFEGSHFDRANADAVIVTDGKTHRVTRHHPILDRLRVRFVR